MAIHVKYNAFLQPQPWTVQMKPRWAQWVSGAGTLKGSMEGPWTIMSASFYSHTRMVPIGKWGPGAFCFKAAAWIVSAVECETCGYTESIVLWGSGKWVSLLSLGDLGQLSHSKTETLGRVSHRMLPPAFVIFILQTHFISKGCVSVLSSGKMLNLTFTPTGTFLSSRRKKQAAWLIVANTSLATSAFPLHREAESWKRCGFRQLKLLRLL